MLGGNEIKRSKRAHERTIFEAFLEVEPEFAGEPLAAWQQPEDEREFPDIKGQTVSGGTVGVELGEWLNEAEIGAAKVRESTERSILAAIADQGPNTTTHIDHVWLHPKSGARIRQSDAAAFRDQLFACIVESDERWSRERFWQGPRGARLSDKGLIPYPALIKHLEAITFHLREFGKGWPDSVDWILFPAWVDSFDENTMLDPLTELIVDKVAHYGSTRVGFDELILVVYYNRAAIYNVTPVTAPERLEMLVAQARATVTRGKGPFDRVFLYMALVPGQVFRID